MNYLTEATIFLGAAAVAAPVSRLLGLGSVLGYVVAGGIIGPFGVGLIDDPESILHFAEIGIVFLLFLIGLELQPKRLRVLRHAIFVVGAGQVFVSMAVIAALVWAIGLSSASGALLVGFALSLSSTAFALQLLAETGGLLKPFGRTGFGTLLFQDLAVIPALAVVSTLGQGALAGETAGLGDVLRDIVLIVLLVAAARLVLRPILRFIALAGVHEAFTAAGLLLVLGAALAFEALGLSLSLGAFVAGVLMADSQFRHQLEADVAPFKGLLLGLFFIAVGMSANVELVLAAPVSVAGMALGLVAVKAAVLYGVGRAEGLSVFGARQYALHLSQGGEFAFVLFAQASAGGLVDEALADLMTVVVSLSMALTPVLLAIARRLARRSGPGTVPPGGVAPEIQVPGGVIIAGFGRFGQVVGRILRAQGIAFTALDASAGQIDFVAKYGNRVYYGDASRLSLLRSARVDRASAFVIAVGDPDKSLAIAETVRANFPGLTVIARARDRQHEIQLRGLGVEHVIRETLLSAVHAGAEALTALGTDPGEAQRLGEVFLEHDARTLTRQMEVEADPEAVIRIAHDSARELKAIFQLDDERD